MQQRKKIPTSQKYNEKIPPSQRGLGGLKHTGGLAIPYNKNLKQKSRDLRNNSSLSIEERIKESLYNRLCELVNIQKSIDLVSNAYDTEGLPFMRVADISKQGLSEPQRYLNDSFVKENNDKRNELKPKKGTVLFTKDGTVGIAHHLREDYKGITSEAILHLNILDDKELLPEYLTLVLNSKAVQMQAERDAGGSIIQRWRISEIENVIIPLLPIEQQQAIAEKIEESFVLKSESERLLELAKRAVEMAVEQEEAVGLGLIEEGI